VYPPHGISNDAKDGLFTSGSFTFEGTFKYSTQQPHFPSESLMRIHSTGSTADRHLVIANLVAVTGSSIGQVGLKLFCQPESLSAGADPAIKLFLTGVDIFDGNKWNISFGRQRNDEINALSSSYYLRCGRQIDQDSIAYFQTSSFFNDVSSGNLFQSIQTLINTSGSFVVIGSQSLDKTIGSSFGLNKTPNETAKITTFTGKTSQIRMWSKYLDHDETKEHIRNFKSLGVKDPNINFSFDTVSSGAFNRLRLDASTDQAVIEANSIGEISIFDFSQNNLFFAGGGFEPNKTVIKPETFNYTHLAPNFDQSVTFNKVRVRSLQSPTEYDVPTARVAPVYDVVRSEEPEDDRRFSIEYSAVKALNEDIVRLLTDLDFFDDSLGKPSYLYDDYYPAIEQMRKIYFNRMTDKLNYTVFFDIFKWFDTSFSDLITGLMPKKAQFNGVNFVIESHMLERHRLRYLTDQQYTIGKLTIEDTKLRNVTGITS
jgi:hypothetical protein